MGETRERCDHPPCGIPTSSGNQGGIIHEMTCEEKENDTNGET